MTTEQTPRRNPLHFFRRERDGSVRVRMKWTSEEATLIEEAAGENPVLGWLYETINDAAASKVKADRGQRPIAPPREQA